MNLDALKVTIDARGIPEVKRELTKLRRQNRALRRAIRRVLEPLTHIPINKHYYLRVDSPDVAHLVRVYNLTAPKEEKTHESQA